MKANDKIVLSDVDIDSNMFGTRYTFTTNKVNVRTSEGKIIVAEFPEIIENPVTANTALVDSYNYYNYVQYEDGTIAEVAGDLSDNGHDLDIKYENILCKGELENDLTWTSEGYTYKVVGFEYVKTNVSVFGAFKIECTGNGTRNYTWWSPEIGFYVKKVSDYGSQILYSSNFS